MNSIGDVGVMSKQLEDLAGAADDEVLAGALQAGGDTVVEGIRARVRGDARRSSGNLARSIKYRLDSSYLTGRAYAVVFGWDKVPVRTSKEGKVTYTSDYGPILEYDSKRQLRHLESGFEDTRGQAEDQMLQTITQSIKESV